MAQSRPRDLPLLEIRKRVLFPGVLLRLQIGRPKSVRLVESIWDQQNRTFKKGAMIAVCTVVSDDAPAAPRKSPSQTAGELDDGDDGDEDEDGEQALARVSIPDGATVYRSGTAARVLQLSRVSGGDTQSFQFSLLVEGVARIRLAGPADGAGIRTDPFHTSGVTWHADEGSPNDTEVRALAINVRSIARELLELQRKRNSPLAKKTKELVDNLGEASPGRLADLLSANMEASVEEKQGVLAELPLGPRLRRALELLNRQVEVFKMSDKIQSEVEGKLKSTQREYYLRQQLRAITDELGNMGGKGGAGGGGGSGGGAGAGGAGAELDEMELLEQALAQAQLPAEARQAADREMQRLKHMQPSQPDYSVIRTYLELMAELPWSATTPDNLDIASARAQLDADHHGLAKVKKRIVEFLAVRSLKRDMKGPILCLVGPPGTGKTSLGKSVADALGRQFRRLALGGVRDEAEIRGHRRTYIGALPGNIVTTLKKAGSSNPVVLLDEIDKLGRDVRGDPSSALLEVLDPEQNDAFVDHYLNVPFDLSKVLFIATANRLDTIPGPLLDRMEVIELQGYTSAEKREIAVKHLVPKQMLRHGISEAHASFTPSAIDALLASYTREAGVRGLDREIAALCRHAAVRVAESRDRRAALALTDADADADAKPDGGGANGVHAGPETSAGSGAGAGPEATAAAAGASPAAASATINEVKMQINDLKHHDDGQQERAAASAAEELQAQAKGEAKGEAGEGKQQAAGEGEEGEGDGDGAGEEVATEEEEEGEEGEDQMVPLVLEHDFAAVVVTPEVVEAVLGPPRYESEVASRTALPGVATGLAWTPVGGEILFIETWLHRGSGRISFTGQLGKVMDESVRAALSFVRGHLSELRLTDDSADLYELDLDVQSALAMADMHVHFPAGGVPKDGPSAGVAITASLVSAISGRRVRSDTACTGEITLRGLVLPVGGVKEKVLAAHTAGIRRVVLPERNRKDAADVPEEVLEDLEVVFVSHILEAIPHLFAAAAEEPAELPRPRWLAEVVEAKRRRLKNASASAASGGAAEDEQGQRRQGKTSKIGPPEEGDDTDGEAQSTGWSTHRDACGPVLLNAAL